MKKSVIKLLGELGVHYSLIKKVDEIEELNSELLIHKIENELASDQYFTYKIKKDTLSIDYNINESFIVEYDDGYSLVLYESGSFFLNGSVFKIQDNYGKKVYLIDEIAKNKTAQEVFHSINSYFSCYDLALPLMAILVLLTPLYVNIFITRLVFNEEIYTTIYISVIFLLLMCFGYVFRKFIGIKSTEKAKKHSIRIEKYIMNSACYSGSKMSVNGVKTIESSHRFILENKPLILMELSVLVVMSMILAYFLQNLFFFYFVFIALSIYTLAFYRFKVYKKEIDSRKVSESIVDFKLSLIDNNFYIPLINKKLIMHSFYSKVKSEAFHHAEMIRFNLDWSELVRLITFLSIIILFILIFFAIKSNVIDPSLIIVLLLINGRVSTSLSSLVSRFFYLKVYQHHLLESLTFLYSDVRGFGNHSTLESGEVKELILNRLTVTFGKDVILSDISVAFQRGMIYGVKGKIGCGKSTLLKVLASANRNYEGEYSINNSFAKSLSESFFDRNFSFIDAESGFISGTLYYNFLLRGCSDKEYVLSSIKQALGGRSLDYDSIYVIDANDIRMSLGQKKKLILLMELYGMKSVYIYDEPFHGLPKHEKIILMKKLRKKSKKSIVIVSSHSDEVLSFCDKVYLLNNRKITTVVNENRISIA